MYKMKSKPVLPSEISSESVWQERRTYLQRASSLGLLSMAMPYRAWGQASPYEAKRNARWSVDEAPTAEKHITNYNNFYEFGMAKEDPARYAGAMPTEPWVIRLDGEVDKPLELDIDQVRRLAPLEERIYRLRCVEAWSMVVPWVGFSLSVLLRQVQPNSKAKYVRFETLADQASMPGLQSRVLTWPYVEGLRIDEAMHPLTMLVLGLYGKVLPNQNGAPLRLMVPWKYGFKSAKSLVRISFVESLPTSSWMAVAPHEYGFFANVNPDVAHPRWSQASERKIGSGLFAARQATLPFNGYAQDVAHLYSGMDLQRNF